MPLVTLPYADPADPRRALDVLRPDRVTTPYALCFVHGGGWTAGSRESWHERMGWAAAHGTVSATLGYRTGHPLADLMADVTDGYHTLGDHLGAHLGERPIVLVGSSAGAHLALLLSLTASPPPAACIALNGPGRMQPWPGMDQGIRAAVDGLGASTAACPRHHLRAGAPPVLHVVVGKERFFPHEHVHELADLQRAAGSAARVELVPDAEHGFFYRCASTGAAQAEAVIATFLAEVTPPR